MLDRELPDGLRVGVMKMDVEGHESNVLRGASAALADSGFATSFSRTIAVIPAKLAPFWKRTGIESSSSIAPFWRPCLLSPSGAAPSVSWLPPNYLATLDPDRAAARCAPIGWQCLRGR